MDGKTGLITELTPESISIAIDILIKDKALRNRFGLAAKAHTQANYSVNRLIQDHAELYKNLISNQKHQDH